MPSTLDCCGAERSATSPRRRPPISYSTRASGTLPYTQSPRNSLTILHPTPTQTASPATAQSTNSPPSTAQLTQHCPKTGPARSMSRRKTVGWKAAMAPPHSGQLLHDLLLPPLTRHLPPSYRTQPYPRTGPPTPPTHQKPASLPPPRHQLPQPHHHSPIPPPLTPPRPHPHKSPRPQPQPPSQAKPPAAPSPTVT